MAAFIPCTTESDLDWSLMKFSSGAIRFAVINGANPLAPGTTVIPG